MTAAILATVLFSLSAVSGKRLSHYLSGVEANFWRFLLSALLLGALPLFPCVAVSGVEVQAFFVDSYQRTLRSVREQLGAAPTTSMVLRLASHLLGAQGILQINGVVHLGVSLDSVRVDLDGWYVATRWLT